jgi:hypothetical protein
MDFRCERDFDAIAVMDDAREVIVGFLDARGQGPSRAPGAGALMKALTGAGRSRPFGRRRRDSRLVPMAQPNFLGLDFIPATDVLERDKPFSWTASWHGG